MTERFDKFRTERPYIIPIIILGSSLLIASLLQPSHGKEVYFNEFQQHLSEGKVKLVTILKNTAADSFNYVALVELIDGTKEYIVLANIDNFLMKLEIAQKEMVGKLHIREDKEKNTSLSSTAIRVTQEITHSCFSFSWVLVFISGIQFIEAEATQWAMRLRRLAVVVVLALLDQARDLEEEDSGISSELERLMCRCMGLRRK